ncbi:histone-lysine N-methyltransferase, H3 lysine-9 specific SUVH4 isoform X3 [Diospyros lotus]|uniref:histone-lysine N-methyltransferase, H3 lysine-9 specific SUVH4 isoform X3 n=1 Tax=Diospyros lotus TaxID=55363 RepID=UPI00225712B3|nr:histone-lysine N-methyltransferase, H3 lysine-9 specific SUVH4 isoform X3 [Diospyros lotus]
MVVQRLRCVNTCENGSTLDNAISVNPGRHHLMVSGVSGGETVCDELSGNHSEMEKTPAYSERRTSARIQKLKAEKALRLRCREEALGSMQEGVIRKKTRVCQRRKVSAPPTADENKGSEGGNVDDNKCSGGSNVPISSNDGKDSANDGGDRRAMVSTGSTEAGMEGDKSSYALVTKTLRIFNKHYLHFVQEEEKRCARAEPNRKSTKGSISKMMETNAILHPDKRFGSIPGIDVGHQFSSRAEMVVVGFHSHWLNGIDFIGKNASKFQDFSGYTLPLAVAIVLSGQYEDDMDNCEEIVYTGQGGNNLLGNKRQIQDQVMERGNLGLKNCMEQNVPVRVVRGHQSANSCGRKVYTYDGLYKVVNYWAEKGVSGFIVYKFRLKRLEGQPLLTTNQVQFARGRIPNSISELRGLVCEDISGGQEDIPIPATNLVDDPPIAPTGFAYCKSIQVAKNVKLPENATGCDCKDTCIDPKRCACARLNGSDFPYVHRDGGRLIEPKSIVFECGPNCRCGPGCVNRTSQRGLRYRLEVFRTPKKGWGVRSWDYIPSGAPVCEYTGILMKADEIDTAHENNYIFDIDCLQTMKGLDGRERRLGDVSLPTPLDKIDDHRTDSVPEFCIDAGSTGNIARFINHSCQPNLFVQCILSSHYDVKLARVVLFAADNISPLKELTYDYGYPLDSVMGPDGKIKQVPCYCGEADCRKRLL